jgi:hypothetical protein
MKTKNESLIKENKLLKDEIDKLRITNNKLNDNIEEINDEEIIKLKKLNKKYRKTIIELTTGQSESESSSDDE